ncbi:Uncharacterised protein [Mycobacterium tuberculosis]|uniref:Uncharacterized protein n=2 Tax=Mycobacterium tuberculosis TaxID=1773 RepID=A0A655JLQ8_MYCTX|nr:Uncharacterised protein [Mycobacterium tuberculosis]
MLAPTKCHHTSTAITRVSRPPVDHQRAGRNRRCRMPSAVSRMCSATRAAPVSATPRIMAAIFSGVGLLL